MRIALFAVLVLSPFTARCAAADRADNASCTAAEVTGRVRKANP